jgi:hypothetical protein
MTLDFLNDVFLLHLAFESAQCVLKGLALLNSDFCQTLYTPKPVPFGPCSYGKVLPASQEVYDSWTGKVRLSVKPQLRCGSFPAPVSSKDQFESELDLSWGIGIGGCQS